MPSPLILSTGVDGASLMMDCGDTPVDEIVTAHDLEPSGYFLEGVLRFLDPALAESLELDSQGDLFCAIGDVSLLERARDLVQPYTLDPERMTSLLDRADAEGIDLEDTEPETPAVHTSLLSRLLRRG